MEKNGAHASKNFSKPTSPKSVADSTKDGDSKIKQSSFFIVGVGASAGGLEAFTQLLGEIPKDTSLAFVLIQHLDPSHESLLTELLAKVTSMSVAEATDGAEVRPGRVYIIPPNTTLTIKNGALRLKPRGPSEGPNLAVDIFFRSLAEDQKEGAIGIVLSGSEFDGALGLEAIKAEGGITFAQDEASAKFKSMPRSAAASGMVDFVLPPRAIAAHLLGLPPFSPAPLSPPAESPETAKDEHLRARILRHLKNATGMDFAFYKSATILRRIGRRMILRKTDGLESYLRLIERDADETQALRKDLLINVTSFFRDPESFELLKKKVFPELLRRRQKSEFIRIWVPGCSTGNEAYSIAICMDEAAGGKPVPVQIFATDVSDSALDSARRGIYPENISLDVSPDRLDRYFEKKDGAYRIKKIIRDRCVFASHNMLTDPPFSSIDLISCRNVMIYMEPPLQKKAIGSFNFSLKPGGYLLLGGSEAVSGYPELFYPMDAKRKIYKKRGSAGTPASRKGAFSKVPTARNSTATAEKERSVRPGFDAREVAKAKLKGKNYTGAALVTEAMSIVEFFGHVQPYIRPAAGQASLNLLQMVHESLLPDLCLAIHKAKKDGVTVRKGGLSAGRSVLVDLEVISLGSRSSDETYFLAVFHEPKKLPRAKRGAASSGSENAALKRDLMQAKSSLVNMMRERGVLADEYRCQSEEMQSSNEEFQSTNEELETAKEELQSANEELTTLNDEMEARNAELIVTNDDLNNLVSSVHTAIILMDGHLRIRRFTTKAAKNMRLTAADIGRRINDATLGFRSQSIEPFVRGVIESLEPKECEIEDESGCSYLMRARPYRRQDGKVDGVVLMFIEIMELKQAMKRLEESTIYSETIVETLWEPLVSLDSRFWVKSANQAFFDFFKVTKEDTYGRPIYALGDGQWNIPKLKELLEELLAENSAFHSFEMEHDFPTIGRKLMSLNAHRVTIQKKPREEIVVLAFQDITAQRGAEDALNQIAAQLAASNRELENFASIAAHDLQAPLQRIRVFGERLLSEPVGENGTKYLHTLIRSADRMSNLVDNLLKVSKVQGHKDGRELVELDEVMKEVLADLEIPLKATGGSVERSPLPAITANRMQMHQLFQNMIGNSLKYSKKGVPPQVLVSCRLADAGVEISVRDNGIGFDEKYSKEVFKPFKRLHGITEYEGSGIGLALCQKIVHSHGGKIEVKSVPGDGTTFLISLPLGPPAEE